MKRTLCGVLVIALSGAGAAWGQATAKPAVLGIGPASHAASAAAAEKSGNPLGLGGLSMFDRNRGAATNKSGDGVTPPAAPVFIGVTRDDRGYAAYVEYPNEVVAVHVGDTVSWNGSTVTAITLDGLQLMEPGARAARIVPLGYNLRGTPGQVGPPATGRRQREPGAAR